MAPPFRRPALAACDNPDDLELIPLVKRALRPLNPPEGYAIMLNQDGWRREPQFCDQLCNGSGN